jgi:quercetin dioxygenase-like cupin family protein
MAHFDHRLRHERSSSAHVNNEFPTLAAGRHTRFMNTTGISSNAIESNRAFLERSPGVEICVLRMHPDGGLTFLVRMKRGARAERHGHPGGEETYVLSGKVRIDRRIDSGERPQPDVLLVAGDYLFAPPGEIHEGFAEEDTSFLVIAPGGLVPTSNRVSK